MLRIHLNLDGHLFRLAENLGFHLELGQTTKTNPFGSCSRFTLKTHDEWVIECILRSGLLPNVSLRLRSVVFGPPIGNHFWSALGYPV